MKELKKQLKSICSYRVRKIKKPKKSYRITMGYCRPWQDSIIRVLPRSKDDFYEVTLYHEWFHLYQYKVNKDYLFEDITASYMVPVGSYPHHVNREDEEEADAFALLLAKRSLQYNLDDLDVRIWLSYMWRHLRRKYPELKELLETHYFTASSGFHQLSDNDGDR